MAKAFAWGYSKLKNFETCPKRHYEIDIAKNFSDGEGEALVWGNRVHEAIADALIRKMPLPAEMADYQKWLDRVQAGNGKLLVEQKFAITRDFQPTQWFGSNVWMRGICDALRVDGPVAIALDWKTGKMKIDSVQLMLMAQCIFAHHPQVRRIRTAFVWLQDDCETEETFDRNTIPREWVGLLPRVQELENAAKNMDYPAKPGRLCARWCPVLNCEYHGRRHG